MRRKSVLKVLVVTLFALVFANAVAAQTKETDRRFEVVGKNSGPKVVVTGHLTYAGQYAYNVYDGIRVKQAGGNTTVVVEVENS